MPAANHTITQICSSEMPTDSAAWWLSATARSARPMRVFWKKSASAATMTEAIDGGGDVDLLQRRRSRRGS